MKKIFLCLFFSVSMFVTGSCNASESNRRMYHVPCDPAEFNYEKYLAILTNIQIKHEKEKHEWKNDWWTTDENDEIVSTENAKNFLKKFE